MLTDVDCLVACTMQVNDVEAEAAWAALAAKYGEAKALRMVCAFVNGGYHYGSGVEAVVKEQAE